MIHCYFICALLLLLSINRYDTELVAFPPPTNLINRSWNQHIGHQLPKQLLLTNDIILLIVVLSGYSWFRFQSTEKAWCLFGAIFPVPPSFANTGVLQSPDEPILCNRHISAFPHIYPANDSPTVDCCLCFVHVVQLLPSHPTDFEGTDLVPLYEL